MGDVSKKATYLMRLLVLFQERATPEKVRALLDEAVRAGVKPNGLYLSALRLHPWDLPLPPDPRLVLEVSAALRNRLTDRQARTASPASTVRRDEPRFGRRRHRCRARQRPHGR
jgi:hypothetical protein